MSVPDLGALRGGGGGELLPTATLMNPPDEVFHANDVGVSVEPNGTLVLSLRYVVEHAVGETPGGQTVMRSVAAKHLHVTMPPDVFIGKLLANSAEIIRASAAQLQEYAALMGSVPEKRGETVPDPEARRRAAGD